MYGVQRATEKWEIWDRASLGMTYIKKVFTAGEITGNEWRNS